MAFRFRFLFLFFSLAWVEQKDKKNGGKHSTNIEMKLIELALPLFCLLSLNLKRSTGNWAHRTDVDLKSIK